jgi:hypothetical protein
MERICVGLKISLDEIFVYNGKDNRRLTLDANSLDKRHIQIDSMRLIRIKKNLNLYRKWGKYLRHGKGKGVIKAFKRRFKPMLRPNNAAP